MSESQTKEARDRLESIRVGASRGGINGDNMKYLRVYLLWGDPEIKNAALNTLEEVMETALKNSKSTEGTVKSNAKNLITKLQNELVPDLEHMLAQSYANVKEIKIYDTNTMGAPRLCMVVTSVEVRNPDECVNCIKALSSLRADSSLPILVAFAEASGEGAEKVRIAVADGVRNFPREEAVKALGKMLSEDGSEAVRTRARVSLEQRGDVRAAGYIAQAMVDKKIEWGCGNTSLCNIVEKGVRERSITWEEMLKLR
ncbi:MAG: HEAT repeat domain-containing protein, partial [Candidatus Micrarchaeota archaeon]